MPRDVLTIDLRDDPAALAAYRQHHAEAWPEVVTSLRAAGITALDIYMLGRRLVMVLEVEDGLDPERAFARHHASASPRVAEWERLMASLQQTAPGARPGQWWARMEPVFCLADAIRRGDEAPAAARQS